MGFSIPLLGRSGNSQTKTPVIGAPSHDGVTEALRIEGVEGRTRITTAHGEIPARLLRPNDRVKTRDGRFLPVLGVNEIRMDPDFVFYHPDARPIRISAGAFGKSRPWEDIYLAPDQVVGGGLSQAESFFCRARDLLDHPMVIRARDADLSYYQIELGTQAAIQCEKVWLRVDSGA